jgi:hypothetical protein
MQGTAACLRDIVGSNIKIPVAGFRNELRGNI